MATIADVARQASVSTTTVSHVLSGKRMVSTGTQRRVLQVISELGYVPSRAGQALAKRQSYTLAILMPNPLQLCLVNLAYTELIVMIMEAISLSGYGVVVFGESPGAISDELQAAIKGRSIDGILWIDPPAEDEALGQHLLACNLPLIAAGKPFIADVIPHVYNDRHQIARLILSHLLAAGHRHLALLTGSPGLMVTRDSVEAFQAEIRNLFPEATLEVVSMDNPTISDGRLATERLLHSRGGVSAVIGKNESLAIGALQATLAHGVAVPDQLAIVSVGNASLLSQFSPSITAVDSNVREIASTVVQMALALVNGDELASPCAIIPSTLVVRDSTAPIVTKFGM